jgi:hypothetical protein
VTSPLGPDAAEIDRDRFHELLGRRRGAIKAALIDQKLIAGLGNLMVDETAWRARVNPRAQVARLSRRRIDRLGEAMDEVVRDSLPTGRVPPAEGWLTRVRDAHEPSCPRWAPAFASRPWRAAPRSGARAASGARSPGRCTAHRLELPLRAATAKRDRARVTFPAVGAGEHHGMAVLAEIPQPPAPEQPPGPATPPDAPTTPPPSPPPAPEPGPGVPEPSPPNQPEPGSPDVPETDPKGPETPEEPPKPEPQIPSP